ACLAKRRSEHSYKRAPSYTDVASMKLKQDVESSWQCPFVSASKEESGAQHAFCNVKKEKREVENPSHSHSLHSFSSSFTSTKRSTRRFSFLLQHPCGFEVVLYGCSLSAREAV
ncbi:MAG: hypothetical protein DRP27_06895, partial [Thermotogae bacterium]